MTLTLDHTIVHARDNLASARFLADILGVDAPDSPAHFTPIVTDNGVALDFMTVDKVLPHHYAFTVSPEEFDAAYERVLDRGLTIYAWPDRSGVGEMNERGGRRGFYFDDPDRNLMELIELPDRVIADEIGELMKTWATAEVDGNVDTLDRLLADGFCGIGPLGFVLDKTAWLNRFAGGLHNEALSFDDLQVHRHGDNVIVVAVQDQRTTFNDIDASGRYRVSVAVVHEAGGWRVASCHIGPLDAHAEMS